MKVITLNGQIINVGPWDYQVGPIYERAADGAIATEEVARADGRIEIREKVIGIGPHNPLPEGAVEEDIDVATTAKGRLVHAGDHVRLRADAYPSIADQLDAVWKGGAAADEMRGRIAAVKAMHPKPQGTP